MSAEVWSKAGQWLSFLIRRDCLLVSQQKLFLAAIVASESMSNTTTNNGREQRS